MMNDPIAEPPIINNSNGWNNANKCPPERAKPPKTESIMTKYPMSTSILSTLAVESDYPTISARLGPTTTASIVRLEEGLNTLITSFMPPSDFAMPCMVIITALCRDMTFND